MRFPFPSFKDWGQTIWLVALMVLWFFIGTAIIFGMVAVGAWIDSPSVVLLSFPIALIVFPICFFTYIHYLRWGQRNPNRPAWLATYPSWNEGVWQWFIIFMAFLGILIFMAAIALLNLGLVFLLSSLIRTFLGEDASGEFLKGFARGFRESTNGQLPERLAPFITILWLFIMALMFRWKRSWERKINSKMKLKATEQPTAQPTVQPATIDDDLAKLKAQIAEEKKNNP